MKTEKPIILKEGGRYAFYQKKANGELGLCIGTLYSCRECGTPTAVNAPWLLSKPSEKVSKQAALLLKVYGPVGCANGDARGDIYCEDCYCTSENVVINEG